MLYTFYKTEGNSCLIRAEGSDKVYVTEFIDYYLKVSGQRALIPFLKGWGQDLFEDYKDANPKVIGFIKVDDSNMIASDKEVLKRCIGKEGFDYAMLHYSDYSSVCYNEVKDKTFHEKLEDLTNAYEELNMYLKNVGVLDV